ncbi:hypothetical protein A7U60_g2827 [Sanghuangporus baumii]|uniref:Uncharacterized protein n=1 Tax=Sanghuangporus baumii TaxID=108892 RepID=A0A9Q5N7N4_SANBA|nr:hypothetical protein A7U60_g2827 [Sanghuangporus baumii]
MSDPHVEARTDHDHDHDHDHDDLDLARRMHERQNRPASIDMALNLERELDDEHDFGDGHGRHSSTSIEASLFSGQEFANMDSEDNLTNNDKRVSLDPQVLQRIVTNLRSELSRVQSERDALAEALAGAPTRERELREALDLLTEKSAKSEEELERLRRKSQDDEDAIQMLRTKLEESSAKSEEELERLRRKSQDDEDAIQMLRTKLEESRRALMRLQTESKRMSQMSHMSVDISRANSLFGGAPSSSKRASFTPLTGSGASQRMQNHRRISSISEPSFAFDTPEPSSPPGSGQAVSWPVDADTKKARRSSAFFGGMPVNMNVNLARSTTPSPPTHQRQLVAENGFNSEEIEALRKERDATRAELAGAKQELAEAQEAREASEQCVAALRSFISAQAESAIDASGNAGSNTSGILKLPPLPTEKDVDESAAAFAPSKKAAKPTMGAGWSFGKLFRAESSGSTSSDGASNAKQAGPANTPDTPTGVISTHPGNSSHSPSPSTATPGGAFSRTFGGFFSGRAPSITSIGSVSPNSSSNPNSNANNTVVKTKPALPPRPPTAHGQQEPTLNGLGSDEEDANDADAEDSIDSTGPVSPHDNDNDAERVSRVSEIWIRNASEASSANSEAGVGVNGMERVSLDSVKEREKERESGQLEGAPAA